MDTVSYRIVSPLLSLIVRYRALSSRHLLPLRATYRVLAWIIMHHRLLSSLMCTHVLSSLIVSYRYSSSLTASHRIVSDCRISSPIVLDRILSSPMSPIAPFVVVCYCFVSYRIISPALDQNVSYRIVSADSVWIVSYRSVWHLFEIASYRSVARGILLKSNRIVS
jgi:hypothetical protein